MGLGQEYLSLRFEFRQLTSAPKKTTAIALIFLLVMPMLASLPVHAQTTTLDNPSDSGTYRLSITDNTITLQIKNQSGNFETRSGLILRVAEIREVAANQSILQRVNLTVFASQIYYNTTRFNRPQIGTNTILMFSPGYQVASSFEITNATKQAKVTITVANFAFKETTSKLVLKLELASDSTLSYDGKSAASTNTSVSARSLQFSWNDTVIVDGDITTGSPTCGVPARPTCNLNAQVLFNVRDGNTALGDRRDTQKVIEFTFPYFVASVIYDPTLGIAVGTGSGSSGFSTLLGLLLNRYVILGMVILALMAIVLMARRRRKHSNLQATIQ